MDIQIITNLILVIVFILLTAFFVGAEFAILKVRGSRLDQLIAKGHKRAKIAKKVTTHLDFYLSACQLGITITAFVLGALGEPTVEKLLHPLFESMNLSEVTSTFLSYAIALALVSFLHVVFGELMPKTAAIQFSEKLTLWLAPPLYWFGMLSKPIIWALNGSSQQLLKLFGVKPAGHETVHTEEEIKWIVDQSFESGEINSTELTYINNIFDFENRKLTEIMVPRDKIAFLKVDSSWEEALELINKQNYTRYPLIENGKCIGFIHAKDMLTKYARGQAESIRQFKREMLIFNEQLSIRDVLLTMQKKHIHIGLVKNNDNYTVGLVTMENILKEIVGEINNEAI